MEPATRKPSKERRHELAREALRSLADGGTRVLTAKRLGESVGISDAAVFKHFPTMAAVVDAAISEFETLIAIPMEAGTDDPLELLRRFFIGRIELIRGNPELLALAFSKNLENAAGKEGAVRVRRVIVRSTSRVKAYLPLAQKAGVVEAGVSATVLTWMLQGAIEAAAKQTGRRLPAEEIWNQVAQAVAGRSEIEKQGSI